MNEDRSMNLMIAENHPAFTGHFPGMPIVPGVVLLDEALYVIGQQLAVDLSACAIRSLKFLSPLLPGEPATVRYEVAANGGIRFDIISVERVIASGVLQASSHES